MVAKKISITLYCSNIITTKLQKTDCATRAFNKWTALQGGTFKFSQ